MKTFRCHQRTKQIPWKERRKMTDLQKEARYDAMRSLRCKNCPDIETCDFIKRNRLRETNKEKLKDRRPKGVHICTPRQGNNKGIDYRCEQCLIDNRKRFMSCGHKNVNRNQTDLSAFTGTPKPKPIQTDVEEVK